jgi:serine/threonine protein kinase
LAERGGDAIGRYKLIEKMGEGGFGTVWRVERMRRIVREDEWLGRRSVLQ